MNKYIVVYDLRGVDKNYDELIDRLNRFPTCLKINNSAWLIKSSLTYVQIRDELENYTDKNDSLFVGELSGTAAWFNADSPNDSIKAALR